MGFPPVGLAVGSVEAKVETTPSAAVGLEGVPRDGYEPLLSLKEVSKIYRAGDHEVHALRDVTCEIYPGEMMAIMGPSGSGKSTLMNIIGCLDKPTYGTYSLDGREVHSMNDNQLAVVRNQKIGFVFQTFNLLRRTDAIRNVELPMLYAGKRNRRRQAEEALKRVGLSARMRHRPNEMSGGEQQRVAIARALVNRPAILLADEPTGNLDSRTGREIIQLFQELNQREGLTVILVTHDPEVSAHTRRVIHIRDGAIVGDERHLEAKE